MNKNIGYIQAISPFPICNHIKDVDKNNIGYVKGIFTDGIPFEAELWSYDGDLNISFVFPILCDIDTLEGCLKNDNILGFHNRVARTQGGVLTIGMVNNGLIDDISATVAYVDYLKEQGVVEFISDMENGSLMLITDVTGNELVHVIITLKEEGKKLAETPLEFCHFPNQIRKTGFRIVK